MRDIWNRNEVVKRISSFTSEDCKTTRNKLKKGSWSLAKEWYNHNPKTKKQIENFYKKTESYIYDLAEWHFNKISKKRFQTILKYCKFQKNAKILDFGAGIGSLNIFLYKNDIKNNYYYDLDSITKKFALFSFDYTGAKVKVLNEVKGKFDVIILLDVLEHVVEPLKLLSKLEKTTKRKAIVFLGSFFVHSKDQPMHLKQNEKYRGKDTQFLVNKGYNYIREGFLDICVKGYEIGLK